MKHFSAVLLGTIFFLGAGNAFAFRAEHFKGVYEVLAEKARFSGREEPAPQKYFICDVDTVGNIWAKYGEGELPADLVKIKDEPSILAAFTFRTGLFFTLEKNALVGEEALAVPGSGNNTLQLKHLANGHYELGVRIDNVVKFYDLGPKQEL